jgi:iron(III) transport system ATP-binding protein
VALARALVIRPDVLLLDEPLSNLDARLRLEMREEIRRLHDRTQITTIYVTHDQKESLSMADRMAVLREGTVEQLGSPREVYRAPANRFVADFIGETNWLEGELEDVGPSHAIVRTGSGRLLAAARSGLAAGQLVWLGFRPEAVRIGQGPENGLATRIVQVTYLGEIEQYLLELGSGTQIKAFEQNPMALRRAGEELIVNLRPENLFVLPRKAGD